MDELEFDIDAEKTQVTRKIDPQEISQAWEASREVPIRGSRALIVVMTGKEPVSVLEVDRVVMIGREKSATLRIKETSVSRRHALITRAADGSFYIEDLNSRNGTLVNGIPATIKRINYGDKIRVGKETLLIFSRQDGVENQVLALQKMESLGRLSRGVAHDFNNLLATMMFNINYLEELTKRGKLTKSELRESLGHAKMAINQASTLTEQLLGFARSGKYEERPVNLSAIIDEVVSLVEHTLEKQTSIDKNLEENLVVIGDSSQLQQVIMNLCINAKDAMPNGGQIEIKAYRRHLVETKSSYLPILSTGEHVVVSIKDNGVGMSEEVRQNAFEPFFTTKSADRGTGLGLATVYGIVKSHGGHINLESRLGQGSTFTLYFAASSKQPKAKEKIEPFFDEDGEGEVILLVDDDDMLLSSVARLLKQFGYRVITCSDGLEATKLYQLHKDSIDLVIMDFIMPRMTGLETFREMKKIDGSVKVIMTSGYAHDDQVRSAQTEGIAAFLKKPCDANMLSSTVLHILRAG